MATARQVARWMQAEVKRKSWLYQQDTAYAISSQFGDDFVYMNRNGNLAISPEVLKEFRCLTEETVVWERGQRCWRLRREHDRPGRQADY